MPLMSVRKARLPGDFVAGDEPRAEAAGRKEVLAGGERVRDLIVAHRGIVEAGIARDMIHGHIACNVAAWFADDQRQFAFIVEVV